MTSIKQAPKLAASAMCAVTFAAASGAPVFAQSDSADPSVPRAYLDALVDYAANSKYETQSWQFARDCWMASSSMMGPQGADEFADYESHVALGTVWPQMAEAEVEQKYWEKMRDEAMVLLAPPPGDPNDISASQVDAAFLVESEFMKELMSSAMLQGGDTRSPFMTGFYEECQRVRTVVIPSAATDVTVIIPPKQECEDGEGEDSCGDEEE